MERQSQKSHSRRRVTQHFYSLRWVLFAVILFGFMTWLFAQVFFLTTSDEEIPSRRNQPKATPTSAPTQATDREANKNHEGTLKGTPPGTETPVPTSPSWKVIIGDGNAPISGPKDTVVAPTAPVSSSTSPSPTRGEGKETEVVVHDNPGTIHGALFSNSGHNGGPFVTELKHLSYCHYEVRNFCVINGTLTFFHKEKRERFRGGMRACNEFSRHSPSIYIKYMSEPLPSMKNSSAVLPAPVNTISKGWILQFWCQDLFHMTLSLLPAFQTKVDVAQSDADVYIQIAKGRRHKGGYCNVKLGHPRDFEDTHNAKYGQDKQFPFAGNPFWPFYRLITSKPEKIHPLVPNQSTQTACYQRGIIDKRYIKDMLGDEARNYSASILNMMGVPPGQPRPCGEKYRVTIIDRRGRTRKLTNIPDLMKVARGVGMEAQSVAFENIPIREQLRIITKTDVLLGVHGNGLMWLQFLPPGSVVIELVGVWYTPYTLLWGHTYFHSRMINNPVYRDRGEYHPFAHNTTEVQDILLKAKEALDFTRCGAKPFVSPNERLGELYKNCTPHC